MQIMRVSEEFLKITRNDGSNYEIRGDKAHVDRHQAMYQEALDQAPTTNRLTVNNGQPAENVEAPLLAPVANAALGYERPGQDTDDEAPLVMPVMNFDKPKPRPTAPVGEAHEEAPLPLPTW